MAKDINSNKPRGAQKKDDDSAVLKIMIALLLLVFSVFMLRLVANNYGTIVGADRIANASAVVAIVFGVLAAAALAAMLLVKSGWVKMAAPYVLAVSLGRCAGGGRKRAGGRGRQLACERADSRTGSHRARFSAAVVLYGAGTGVLREGRFVFGAVWPRDGHA